MSIGRTITDMGWGCITLNSSVLVVGREPNYEEQSDDVAGKFNPKSNRNHTENGRWKHFQKKQLPQGSGNRKKSDGTKQEEKSSGIQYTAKEELFLTKVWASQTEESYRWTIRYGVESRNIAVGFVIWIDKQPLLGVGGSHHLKVSVRYGINSIIKSWRWTVPVISRKNQSSQDGPWYLSK